MSVWVPGQGSCVAAAQELGKELGVAEEVAAAAAVVEGVAAAVEVLGEEGWRSLGRHWRNPGGYTSAAESRHSRLAHKGLRGVGRSHMVLPEQAVGLDRVQTLLLKPLQRQRNWMMYDPVQAAVELEAG